jgi:hypothetical protein
MNIRHYYNNQFQIEITGKNKDFEQLLLQNPDKKHVSKLVLSYCVCTKEKWDEGEKAIIEAEDSETAIHYVSIIKKRFIEAEPIIARSTAYIKSYLNELYRLEINKEGVKENLEKHFLDYLTKCSQRKSDDISSKYKWKEEYRESTPAISAAMFAFEIKKSRWPEAEEIIKNDDDAVLFYCHNVLKTRWKEAENAILSSKPNGFYNWNLMRYLKDFVKERWPEAEEIIKAHPSFAFDYTLCFVQDRWHEAEPHIRTDPKFAFKYAKEFIKGRWPEAEEFIAENPELTYEYAKGIIGGKLPEEMHNRVLILAMQKPKDPYLKKYFGYKKYRKETAKSR